MNELLVRPEMTVDYPLHVLNKQRTINIISQIQLQQITLLI